MVDNGQLRCLLPCGERLLRAALQRLSGLGREAVGQRLLSLSAHTPSSFLRPLPRGKNWVSPGCQPGPGPGPDGGLGLCTNQPLGEWVGREAMAQGELAWAC